MKYCPECGAKLEPDDEFCPDCGAKIPKGKKAEEKEAPKTATAKAAASVAPSPSGVRFAGFWIRFLARLVDSIIVMVPIFIILGMFGLMSTPNYYSSGPSPASVVGIFIGSLLSLIYFIALDATGGTLGKRIFGLRVINLQKENIGVGRALVRHLVFSLIGIIPFIGWLFVFLGYIWVGIDKHKQGWHDKMAGSFVMYKAG